MSRAVTGKCVKIHRKIGQKSQFTGLLCFECHHEIATGMHHAPVTLA